MTVLKLILKVEMVSASQTQTGSWFQMRAAWYLKALSPTEMLKMWGAEVSLPSGAIYRIWYHEIYNMCQSVIKQDCNSVLDLTGNKWKGVIMTEISPLSTPRKYSCCRVLEQLHPVIRCKVSTEVWHRSNKNNKRKRNAVMWATLLTVHIKLFYP